MGIFLCNEQLVIKVFYKYKFGTAIILFMQTSFARSPSKWYFLFKVINYTMILLRMKTVLDSIKPIFVLKKSRNLQNDFKNHAVE